MKRSSKQVYFLILLAFVAWLGVGCDSSPSVIGAEGPTDVVVDHFSIEAPDVVALSPGESVALETSVQYKNGFTGGNPFPVQWSSQVSTRVEVDAAGRLRAGSEIGAAWVFAEVGGKRDSVAVWIQKPKDEPSTFEITLFFHESVPEYMYPPLRGAAMRWERVVRSGLPEVGVSPLRDACGANAAGLQSPQTLHEGTEKGVRIFVYTSEHFVPGYNVAAVGGPCIHRPLPAPTTVMGKISLNSDVLAQNPDPRDWERILFHEMGHVLGLAGAIQGAAPDLVDRGEGGEWFKGHFARHGFNLDTNQRTFRIRTDQGHWTIPGVMGLPSSNTLLNTSVGALMDIGYPAAWYAAGEVAFF